MNSYLAPHHADLHRAALLEEAANERLARLARDEQPATDGRRRNGLRLVALVAAAGAVILAAATTLATSGAVEIAQRCCRA